MLLSLAIIVFTSLLMTAIFKKLGLPGILGMLLSGIMLGPYAMDAIDGSILGISEELREIALIVILIRAGLSLDLKDLKKVGRPAILLSFLPATIEIVAITIIAPRLFGISYISAMTMGTIVAAVSPAVVVPRMIQLIHKGYGKHKQVPQMILAAASIDDVYAIILFYATIQYQQGQDLSFMTFLNIPISIVLGILLGLISGYILVLFFKKVHIRDTVKILIIFSVGFVLLAVEDALQGVIAISGLLAVMSMAVMTNRIYIKLANRLIARFEKIWVVSEMLLFVLVGALVNVSVLVNVGVKAIALILISLTFRMVAVYLSTLKTNLNTKEKLYAGFSYLPKATVQAAIGAIPLTLGLAHGELILMVSVLAIVITAPLGAILMDKTYDQCLTPAVNQA